MAAHDTHLTEGLSCTCLYEETLIEDVACARSEYEHAKGYSCSEEDVDDMSLQLGKGGLFIGVCPAATHPLARAPESQMIILAISVQHMLDDFRVTAAAHSRNDIGAFLLGLELVAVTELEEAQIGILVTDVSRDAFQSAKEEGLPERVEVLTERIEEFHQILAWVGLQSVIVSTSLQAVVQYLTESSPHQLLPYQVLQFVALVLLALYRQTAAQGGGNLHLIITIDAKNVFHHVAWTLHVHPIGRDYERQAISILLSDLHFQTGHYTADGLGRNMLTDEGIHIGILEIHGESLHRLWTCISYLHAHLGSCQLFGHEGSSLEGINLSIGVHSALKTETGS